MTDPAIAEAARMLAARRPRATYTCEVCGENFEALVRTGSKAPRTCPRPKSCRDRLYRQRKAAGRGTSRMMYITTASVQVETLTPSRLELIDKNGTVKAAAGYDGADVGSTELIVQAASYGPLTYRSSGVRIGDVQCFSVPALPWPTPTPSFPRPARRRSPA